MTTSDSALGNQLVRDKIISEEQLRMALEFQQSLGGDLKVILMKLGLIKENVLLHVVAEREHVHDTDLAKEQIDGDALDKLGRENAEKYQVVPLKRDTSYVVLAMGDPNDFKTIETVQFLLNRKVEGVLASRAQIRQALQQHFHKKDATVNLPAAGGDKLERIAKLSSETLLRALVLTLIESGKIDADAFLAQAQRLK